MPEADFESKFKKEKKLEEEIWPAPKQFLISFLVSQVLVKDQLFL